MGPVRREIEEERRPGVRSRDEPIRELGEHIGRIVLRFGPVVDECRTIVQVVVVVARVIEGVPDIPARRHVEGRGEFVLVEILPDQCRAVSAIVEPRREVR